MNVKQVIYTNANGQEFRGEAVKIDANRAMFHLLVPAHGKHVDYHVDTPMEYLREVK